MKPFAAIREFEDEHHDAGPPLSLAARNDPPAVVAAASADVNAGDGEMSRDRKMAAKLVKMVQELNQAMDDAKRSGLIVEPSLSTVQSQFGGDGSAGHLMSVKVFRKLC